jgi:NhaA family Na+:H+ antiporter
MATDIALAVGVLAVAGNRIPPSMRAFLLAFAIVDDVGAIVIIAAFYSTDLAWTWLGAALAAFVATALIRRIGAKQTSFYVALGVIAWFGLHEGGVHATLAGVVMGLLAPTSPHIPPELVDREDLADISSPEAVKVTTKLARGSVSVVEWLQNVLHPWTSYVIVPIFAFANIGIEISADSLRAAARSPITWGIVTGLVAGKPIGILLARHLVGRFQPGDRTRASRRQVLGVGTAAGIGFSVALFISELAFADPGNQAEAKLAILLASLIAAAISLLLLVDRRRRA